MNRVFNQRGQPTLEKARNLILLNCKDETKVSEALRYFSKVTLQNVLPVFPALISLACETVGDDPKKTIPFAEAIVLVTGAADLHDDVIDQTFQKSSKLTVMGKFGVPVTILAGDVLLSWGLSYLHTEIGQIEAKKSALIRNLLMAAIVEICDAESAGIQQANLKFHLSPSEYYAVIYHKAVVPDLAMRIGAILGDGSARMIDVLGQIGRTFGIVSLIIEEFTDIFDRDDLRNRLENGCYPLPLIYALQGIGTKKVLLPMLDNISAMDVHNRFVETVVGCPEVRGLVEDLILSINSELLKIKRSAVLKKHGELEPLFLALLNYLNDLLS